MKKIMITVLLIVITLAMLVAGFFLFAPQLGKKATGNRLERMENSPNFSNNTFHNPVRTIMQAPPRKAMREFLGKKVDRVPEEPIETWPVNKNLYATLPDSEVIVTWLGHSAVLLKMNGTVILTDPVFSKRASLLSFAGPKKFDYTHDYAVEKLPPVDVVVLSHDHYDHLDYKSIKKLNKTVKLFFMPLGVGAHLERWGIPAEKMVELDWWETITFNHIEFTATPSRHFTGRRITDRFQTLWCGWAIKSSQSSIFFTGDSGYYNGFKEIGKKLGPFDFSIVECGQYNKYWPSIHMMPEESVKAAIDLRSKVAMPVHWGKFSLSIHSWYDPPTRFFKEANRTGLAVALPEIGKTFRLSDSPVNKWW
ncbi:MAG: MBL fold metallo-hydrolase [Prolixibacteraceae bacterium]|nr:MBL fold metallo-hydrolase [Prolixibacteraceae bacterium]